MFARGRGEGRRKQDCALLDRQKQNRSTEQRRRPRAKIAGQLPGFRAGAAFGLLRFYEERVEGARKGFARMSSSVASSGLSETGDRQWGPRRVRCPVLPARGGDHEPIFEFLSPIFPNFSAVRFKASLDDPFYEPRDRLLLRRTAASSPTSTLPTA